MSKVEFMVLRDQSPIFGAGTLISAVGDVVFDAGAASSLLSTADVVHVKVDGSSDWARGSVTGIVGTAVTVSVKKSFRQDGRDYPRMFGALSVGMSLANDRSEAWLAGDPVEGEWLSPDPFMNFSASGLLCCVDVPGVVGETYLVSLSIPALRSETWRMTATLVRSVPVAGTPDHHEYALNFLDIPAAATEGLVSFTTTLLDPDLSARA